MNTPKFHVSHLHGRQFSRTMLWALSVSAVIVTASAALARAAHNFTVALIEKPDIAVYLLLPDENITTSTLLREGKDDKGADERSYLVQTKDGPKFVKLKKGEEKWYVAEVDALHGDEPGSGSSAQH